MANLDMPKGLEPVSNLNGNPWMGGSWMCYVASGSATALYVGDPVIHEGTACTEGCCMTVGIATAGAGSQVLGAIVSFEPDGPNIYGWNAQDARGVDRAGSLLYRATGVDRYVNVCIDPDTIYEIQADTDTALAYTTTSSNADLVAGTGSDVTGRSGWELDASSATTTLNLQLHMLSAVASPDNDVSLIHSKWNVLLNMSVFIGALGRVVGV